MDRITATRIAGQLNSRAIDLGFAVAKVGITTRQIDHKIGEFIVKNGGSPAFVGFRGYPGNACIFTNDTIVHGLPNDVPLAEGDILTIDCGVRVCNYCVDSARTRIIGKSRNKEDERLVYASEQLTRDLMSRLKAGVSLYDIAAWSEELAAHYGVNIFHEFGGHGIGVDLHMPPFIYFRLPESQKTLAEMRATKLTENQIVCLEPIVTNGLLGYDVMSDGWTIKSRTGAMSAQTEFCILIKTEGCEILS